MNDAGRSSTANEEQRERLRQEYNAAVANGLVIKARRIGRVLDAITPSDDASGRTGAVA